MPAAATTPVALFVVGAISQYIGAAIAVGLFPRVPPATLAWSRSLIAVVWILPWVRARPWQWARTELADMARFGLFLVCMNSSFYMAIDRLPLGTAVAIEFLGPVVVGLVGCRSRRNLIALITGTVGVALLAGIELRANAVGLAWIAVAGVCWAGYILTGSRAASHGRGTAGLAVAMACGAALTAPVLAPGLHRVQWSLSLLGLLAVVGLLTSAVPYGLEQWVLRRVPPTQFAILLAVLPATAAIVGAIALRQVPSWIEVVGIAAVVVAVAVRDTSTASGADAEE